MFPLEDLEFLPSEIDFRIVQVRHPMERLLGTWRHLFNDGGWRSLEHPEFVNKYENSYSKIDFPNFVEEVVLKDKFPRTESELDDLVIIIRVFISTLITHDKSFLTSFTNNLL